jgi:2-oxoisovalerate dehydrogenase E1 component alpha subunit
LTLAEWSSADPLVISPDDSAAVDLPQVGHPDETPDAEFVQLLRADGQRVSDPRFGAELDYDGLRQAYGEMARARRLDIEGTALQRQGELGMWIPQLGQEAAQVGSALALTDNDFAFPSYREHAVALHRGVAVAELLAVFRGIRHGGWDPQQHRFGLYTIVIGAHTLHATGYAMGIQRDQAHEAVIAYFGDGAMSQGDTNEAFIWAASMNAPIVFFCQNNQYAISAPSRTQSHAPLYRRAQGFGFPGVRVDGNDVLAVHAVTSDALWRARSGGGPTLIEAYTYRLGPHTTSDDPTRYRSSAEEDRWRVRDPLARVRAHLLDAGEADERWFADLDDTLDAFGATVRDACHALPTPDLGETFAHVHAEITAESRAQQQWLADYLDSFR